MLEQWRAASGTPISDEAKIQFCVHALGDKFQLADVRLWSEHHKTKHASSIFLEFFFDGAPEDISGEDDAFTKSFETMIEDTLRERRATQFKKKLQARSGGAGLRSRGAASEAGGEGGHRNESDEEWKQYLKGPAPATELTVRSIRESGCMLRFVVCQTSLSVSASEELGQIAFPEHFPINGVAQAVSTSTAPLPRWVYGLLAGTAVFGTIMCVAWWQIMKEVFA